MNNKQQGFEDNNLNDLYNIILPNDPYTKFGNPSKSLQSRNKYKINFKTPLTVFNSVNVTQSPDEFIELDWNCYQGSSQSRNDYLSDIKKFLFEPVQSIVVKQEKSTQLLCNQQVNRLTLQKASDVFPKKYICLYNRFQQNIFLKCDLTIVVKNIGRCLKLQLLKSVESSFPYSEMLRNKPEQRQHSEDRITQVNGQQQQPQLLLRRKASIKSKRYESSHTLRPGNYDSKILTRKVDYSPFELQKSMILNHEIKQRICQLEFYSNFESGNLHLVFKDKAIDNLFYLFLTNDTNTHGFNQWFYFGVRHVGSRSHLQQKNNLDDLNKLKKYRFVVMNISKEFKYDPNMKLLTLLNGTWQRNTPFNLYKNKYSRYNGGNLITLDFQYEFQPYKSQGQQPVFFSFCYPYTYTRAIRLMKEIKLKQYKNLFVTVQALGKTQLTNFIPALKIEKVQSKKLKDHSIKSSLRKKIVLIVARQHAGESPSSFICQSLIRNLLQSPENLQHQWQSLLSTYQFIILPMCNPDGVIHGNSRTNIKGYDINRLWQPSKNNNSFMSTQTEEINNYITLLLKQGTIEYTIDLHSHSKQYGSFVYCCDNSETSKMFRYYFAKSHPECEYDKCKVNLTGDKKCTFRGQMYHRLGIKNSFTIETSFYGYFDQNQRQNQQTQQPKLIPFTMQNFNNIAKSILYALQQTTRYQQQNQASMEQKQVFQIIDQLDNKIRTLKRTKLIKNNNSESDSDPQNEYLQMDQRKQNGENVSVNKVQTQKKKALPLSSLSKKNQRSQSLTVHNNRSLQLVSKIEYSFQSEPLQTKRKRKRIYSNLGHGDDKGLIQQPFNDLAEGSMPKKFLTQAQRQIDFRKTLRRGYRMAQSDTGFYKPTRQEVYKKKPKQPQTKQPANCIVYPTQTDLQINSENIRLLHETLFKGRIKVKSIKEQQVKFLKRVGLKSTSFMEDKLSSRKNIFQNKFIQEKSVHEREFSDFLSVERIEQVKFNSSFSLRK